MCVCIILTHNLDTNQVTEYEANLDVDSNLLLNFVTEGTINHQYNVTVNASNAAGSTLSPPITISTYVSYNYEVLIMIII